MIRGVFEDGVVAWKGIPFAAPPVGANRWRAPQPVSWHGVRETTEYGHDCMQNPFPGDAAPLGTEPAEDCLVLNVWRPANVPRHVALPVMVWIYGGGFVNGGSSPAVYNGAKFAQKGIVFVSFNYRVGRFGFFAHPALTAAKEGPLGNYGYLDQIEVLRWVKRNISQFGGDPSNVTVFGESAGGGSTLNILISPMTRGLFNRVAVMSGGGRPASFGLMHKLSEERPGSPSAESIGVNFAHSLGIEGTGPDALAKLRALPADQVVQGLNLGSMTRASQTYAGGPIEDGSIVIPQTAQAMIQAVRQRRVQVLIGSTSADIGFPFVQNEDGLRDQFGDRADAVRAAYHVDHGATLREMAQSLAMDATMTEPARYVAGIVASTGQRAYYYRFSYVAESLRAKWKGGATHASDIPFMFDTVAAKYGAALTAKDETMAQTANTYFTNFAKSGDPDSPGLPRWEPYTPENGFLMDFSYEGTAMGGPDPWKDRLDLVAERANGLAR
jgi:para-nitrobenzyl esterase